MADLQLRTDVEQLQKDHATLFTEVALLRQTVQTMQKLEPIVESLVKGHHEIEKNTAFTNGALKALIVIWSILATVVGLWIAYKGLKN